MIKITIIENEKLQPIQWDGGLTYEYFIYPENAKYKDKNFDFRISCATIEKTPAVFTQFKGYNRYLMMLDNELIISRNQLEEAYAQHQIFDFDSNDHILSYSKGNDFNLMVSNQQFVTQMLFFKGKVILRSKWIILFATTQTNVRVNDINYCLNQKDCLIIYNIDNQKVRIDVMQSILKIEIN